MLNAINGILLLDKPIHFTSNRALQKIKHLFKAKKAGHTGSLDPIATGMLPICFGEATKFSQFLLDSDKAYHVTAKLGIQTTTGDTEGEIVAVRTVSEINKTRVEEVLQKFVGEIDQIPPMYSAIKYKGEPLYKLARNGIEIPRKPRRIKIFSLQLEAVNQDEIVFHVHCSKGTYIRTLVEDIGRELGCGGHVRALRRIKVAPYGETPMYTIQALEKLATQSVSTLLTSLLPTETALQVFPAVTLSTAAAFYLRTGQSVRASFPLGTSLVRLISENGKFLGIGKVTPEGRIQPYRLLAGY